MFARDGPHIANIHDATLMPDDTHSDGVFAHFGSYIAIHLDAKFFQHQQPCTGRGQGQTEQRKLRTVALELSLTKKIILR